MISWIKYTEITVSDLLAYKTFLVGTLEKIYTKEYLMRKQWSALVHRWLNLKILILMHSQIKCPSQCYPETKLKLDSECNHLDIFLWHHFWQQFSLQCKSQVYINAINCSMLLFQFIHRDLYSVFNAHFDLRITKTRLWKHVI